VPPLPSPAAVVRLARQQAEAVVALPGALLSLTRAVGSLDGTIREARDAVARLTALGTRLEAILDEVEEPVKDLAPGLRRLGEVLDDPAVSDVPDTIRRIREDVLPLVATLRGTTDVLGRFGAGALLGGGRGGAPGAPPRGRPPPGGPRDRRRSSSRRASRGSGSRRWTSGSPGCR
jgi:ABC-type transporter Mla subunit MlaD